MRIAILIGVALSAACGRAYALDCSRPSMSAARVICSDAGLRKLFDQRQQAYEAAKARSNEAERKALADDNRRWLKSYQAACGIAAAGGAPPLGKAVVRCFARAFKARIAWLRNYPAAAQPGAATADSRHHPPSRPQPEAPTAAAPVPALMRREFTFACRTPEKLVRVLRALAANDLSYPLNQPDCLPLVKGRAVAVIARDGKLAKIRLCNPDAGCVEVYADAASIGDDAPARAGQAARK
jgi:hypothetical protein